MARTRIERDYFDWMYDLVCGHRYGKRTSFRQLLLYLHEVEFKDFIPNDSNRGEDGVDLRYRYAYENDLDCDIDLYLTGPCTVLEMMIALAIRCEESIMDDPAVGNRTAQWFWKMIVNLGLGDQMDGRFDVDYVWEVVEIFLNREYEPNGRGGLFYIKNTTEDLRNVEIWVQMLWYLNSIT